MTRLDTKQKVILSVIFILIVLALTLLIGKVTYSYLGPDIDDQIVTEGEVTASGDTLIFSKGNSLSLKATTDNFNTTSGNLTSTVNPTAKLVASNKNNNATAKYNVGFMIKENTYQYSTSGKTAELILTVKDETGATISSAEGLTYVTVNGVSGFDITGKTGAFTVAKNHSIATTSSTTGTTQKWTFTLTFINYTTDQSINENANLQMYIVLQKEEIFYHTYCDETLFACKVAKTYGVDTNLYLHNSSLANSAEDGSYRYAGSSASVNNYVCFGSDEETCPNDNIYRVIGVFGNQVKLIKADYANSNMLGTDGDYNTSTYAKSSYPTYKGNHTIINRYNYNYKNDITINDGHGLNDWETSLLNKTNLNKNYINYLNTQDTKWANMIADTKWNIGGYTTNDATTKTFYNAEKTKQTSEASKIGLMYTSDYGYATLPSNWNTNISSYNTTTIKDNNWMYMGLYEWTITPDSSTSYYGFHVRHNGSVDSSYVSIGFTVRPVLYLKADVTYVSGEGTSSNPFRIK